ncbi:type II secretion system protein N [Serratia sp. UGAL515B_01]|uniref:type II secretion system protein N n=1 Tax=Serratia sp. UGAL515B_01 TaxID=2986763 RepID=UPI0029553ED2|nr:type II secretion system protein N [Serratia sp. UGAL515B_01]WON78980.1 type II secretion system protein N [Serratia sp. UGAL515B_01]
MGAKAKKVVLLLACYLLLLCWNAPAQVLRNFLPADMRIGSFAGSLWQGSLRQFNWQQLTLAEVNWQITLSSWRPALKLELRGPQGIQGAGTLRGWFSLQLYQWQFSAPADWLQQQLPLPLPVTAQGNLQLRLQQGEIGPGGCVSLIGGAINWHNAQLETPLGAVELTHVQGRLSCDKKGALALVLKQNSAHLSLTGQGNLGFDGRYQFNGQLRGGPELPNVIKPLMNQLGKANDQGQIAWQVQGRVL